MNWIDAVIVVVLVVSAFLGLRTGLVKAVANLVGVVGGVYLAGLYYDDLGDILTFISSRNFANVAGFLIIFVAVFVAAVVLGNLISKLIQLVFLGWVDRLAGLVLGLVVSSAGIAALLVAVHSFPFSNLGSAVEESRLGSYMVDHYPVVIGLLPEEFSRIGGFLPRSSQ